VVNVGFTFPEELDFELDEQFFEDWVNVHGELVRRLRSALELAEAYDAPGNPVLANAELQSKVLLVRSATKELAEVMVRTRWRTRTRADRDSDCES
jgi:hypothetical protein